MKRIPLLLLPVLLAFAGSLAVAADLLRIVNGTEEYASIPAGLPAAVTNAYAERLHATGYRPVATEGEPRSSWCTRAVRTVTLTNDVYLVRWIECSVPIPLDRTTLCSAILSLPDGTNVLAAAMSQPAVADWFVSAPVYTRGSALALAMQRLLGVDRDKLETLLRGAASNPAQASTPTSNSTDR